ncbi:vWA domain-containing protein [Candidatus Liberibacter americanus]|uniref:Flp pilus assembly protein TadG n=1 Tax=Candidatus Liberibacter americanus str. Sao Paulo TaxID=1261131 RepID=U6B8L7_9HYPH|nr:vWA domain-containing protein [Candidatus Liberibacter americanus]AHA28181.1 Flp pilus assembly protein TadG [Candidatus Liberibacter americanus str. Sao Paulo]EMS36302.1 von Willebrand factor A [Candidatus Liberibacter americanus PW_SP]
MRLFRIFLSKIKGIILSDKASLLIIFCYSIIPLLIIIFFIISLVDLYHKKIAIDTTINSVILSAGSKMASNFSYFSNNISKYSEGVIIYNIKTFIKNNIKESLSVSIFDKKDINFISDNVNINISPRNNYKNVYDINLTTYYYYHFPLLGNILGDNKYATVVSFVSAVLTMDSTNDDVSFLEFLIDLSGSMHCPIDDNPENNLNSSSVPCVKDRKRSKITALKKAMLLLLDTIESLPNVTKRFYMGLIGYTEKIVKQISPSWGGEDIREYTLKGMDAVKFAETDSSPAMKKAYKILTADERTNFFNRIFLTRFKVPSTSFRKYIVFLTDGENNNVSSDKRTLKTCNKAKNHSIRIFTISINAPAVGVNLLKKCASSIEDYYNVSDINSLLKVFKNISNSISKSKYSIVLNA